MTSQVKILHVDLSAYIISALRGFKNNPADSDFQRGYEAALKELATVFEIEVK